MSHLQLHTSGHLTLHSSGHLALRHPGFTFALLSSSSYGGNSSVLKEIEYDKIESIVKIEMASRINASIASMSSSGSSSGASINAGYYPSGGQYYTIWGEVYGGGSVYSVLAKDGADFGTPKCDLEVTVTAASQGVSGTPIISIGTGSISPTGNPIQWSGITITSSTTLFNFQFGTRIWFSCWFTSPASVTSLTPSRTCKASLKFTNVKPG